MTTELREWTVRLQVTPEQYRALRKLAVEREQPVHALIVAALQTSSLTHLAFEGDNTQ
jgi:hypothetical protein